MHACMRASLGSPTIHTCNSSIIVVEGAHIVESLSADLIRIFQSGGYITGGSFPHVDQHPSDQIHHFTYQID